MSRHRPKKPSPFPPSWAKHLTETERQRLAALDQRIDAGAHARKERAQLIDLVARRAHQARIEKKAKEAQQ